MLATVHALAIIATAAGARAGCDDGPMRSVNRLVGGVSRRLDRPELLAVVSPEIRQQQREELAIHAILACALAEDAVYVDVGTNRGQILGVAARLAPQARHIAFEPIPALAAEIRRGFPGVDVRELALGEREDVAQFCHFRKLDGWSGLRRSPEISDERGEPEFFDVRVSTLDDQLAEATPSVVKIDVEGAELAVLEGGRRLLARAMPTVLFEHVPAAAGLYGAPPGAPWDLLDELGYRVCSVLGEGPVSREQFVRSASVVNWLATPRRRSG
jgi:FkbM family methyltransferase